jgi:O-methyltransferase involved in polyketide biosynthesis
MDEKAQQILDQIEYPFKDLKIPKKTTVTLLVRAEKLDSYTKAFLQRNPNGLVLHLGCGLDSRCLRVTHDQATWIDLDMPDVIELRRKLYPENEGYKMIACSVTDLAWLDQVEDQRQPVLVIAEGLLMYLHENEIRDLFLALQACFPGCQVAFDAFSQYTTDRIKNHPSLKKTGAVIHWGIDDPHDIENWSPGIEFLEEWYFSQSPLISRMDAFYKLMFKLTAYIKIAQQAQRILFYKLN